MLERREKGGPGKRKNEKKDRKKAKKGNFANSGEIRDLRWFCAAVVFGFFSLATNGSYKINSSSNRIFENI